MTKPLNVCLSSMHFYPAVGGGQLRFLRYMPGFRARGVESIVFTGTPSLERAATSGLEPTWMEQDVGHRYPPYEVNGVNVHQVRMPEASSLARNRVYGRNFIQFCQENRESIDLIQLLNPTMWSGPWMRTLRRMKIPMVFTLTLARPLSKSLLKRTLQRPLWSYPMRQCDGVVVSSAVVRESVRQLGFQSPIDVITNGVDTERYCPSSDDDDRQQIRQQLQIPPEAPVLLYVGIIQPRKGIDFLLKSWQHLVRHMPDAHFVLAGSRDDLHYEQFAEFRQKLERLLAESGAADRVHFVGKVDNPEAYYRASDVFVFGSSLEGMGNVLLEAMASELPVVTTPFIGLPEEIGVPGEHYLLAERDPVAMSDAIQQAVQDQLQGNAIGRRAREWAIEHLSLEKTIDQYAELYRRIVERRRPVINSRKTSQDNVSDSVAQGQVV